jgi:O-antigen/teichoic acid export membrane protein
MKEKIQLLIKENTRYLLNLSTTYLSQLISAVMLLVITPILLTRLGNKDFSLYGLVLNAVFLAGVFDCGLNMGLLKKLIADRQNQHKLISTVFYFFIRLFFLGLPISYFLLNRFWGTNGFYGFITVVLISQTILILFFDVMLQSVNKIYLGRTIRIIKLLLEFIILFLLSSFASVYWLLLASIVLNFLYIGALFYYAKKEVSFQITIRDFSSVLLIQNFAYSWWYFMSAVTVVLVFNAQLMMMGWVASAEAIAKFLVVSRLFDIIRIGISNFTLILFPTLAAIQHEGDWYKINILFKRYYCA